MGGMFTDNPLYFYVYIQHAERGSIFFKNLYTIILKDVS